MTNNAPSDDETEGLAGKGQKAAIHASAASILRGRCAASHLSCNAPAQRHITMQPIQDSAKLEPEQERSRRVMYEFITGRSAAAALVAPPPFPGAARTPAELLLVAASTPPRAQPTVKV